MIENELFSVVILIGSVMLVSSHKIAKNNWNKVGKVSAHPPLNINRLLFVVSSY